MKNITFFDTKSYDKKIFDQVNKDFKFQINYVDERISLENVDQAKGSEVICVFVEDEIDKKIISKLLEYNVKLIALRCAGYNNIDLKHAKNKIKVVRVPDYSPTSVAEHAMALILSLNRKTYLAYFRTRIGDFSLDGMLGFNLFGKTIGIVGTGKIGKEMIDIANGFKMRVLAYDLYPNETLIKEKKCTYVTFDELLKESDIISLHCPLTKENHYLIRKETIKKMKDNVMIINTGRGKLINTKDLIEELKNKKVYGAGIDVYEEESNYFYKDYSTSIITDDTLARLIFFPNVIVTSHQGFFTKEALENIAKTTLQNIKDFNEKKELKNEIVFEG